MFWIAWLTLTIVAAGGGAVVHFSGSAISVRDLAAIYLICLVATELGIGAIALLKGHDQAAATQAGLSGLMVLMMLGVGGLIASRLAGLIAESASLVKWSPLLFFVSLALVAADAIRTIRQSPPGGSKMPPDAPK